MNYTLLYTPELFLFAFLHEFSNNIKDWLGNEAEKFMIIEDFPDKSSFKKYAEDAKERKKDFEKGSKKLLEYAYTYFYKDLFCFYFGYKSNDKLYVYWHLAHFIQTAKNYETTENVEMRHLFPERFILRIFILLRFYHDNNQEENEQNKESFIQYLKSFLEEKIVPECLVTKWENKIEEYVNKENSQGTYKNLEDFYIKNQVYLAGSGLNNMFNFLYINAFINVMPKEDLDFFNGVLKNIRDEKINYFSDMSTDYLEKLNQYTNKELKDEKEENLPYILLYEILEGGNEGKDESYNEKSYYNSNKLKSYYETILKNAKEGIFEPVKTKQWEFLSLQNTVLGYLQAIMDLNIGENQKMDDDVRLKRDVDSGDICTSQNKNKKADYLLNPVDDIFVISYAKRRKHMALKTNTIITLWNEAQKNKASLFHKKTKLL